MCTQIGENIFGHMQNFSIGCENIQTLTFMMCPEVVNIVLSDMFISAIVIKLKYCASEKPAKTRI